MIDQNDKFDEYINPVFIEKVEKKFERGIDKKCYWKRVKRKGCPEGGKEQGGERKIRGWMINTVDGCKNIIDFYFKG